MAPTLSECQLVAVSVAFAASLAAGSRAAMAIMRMPLGCLWYCLQMIMMMPSGARLLLASCQQFVLPYVLSTLREIHLIYFQLDLSLETYDFSKRNLCSVAYRANAQCVVVRKAASCCLAKGNGNSLKKRMEAEDACASQIR